MKEDSGVRLVDEAKYYKPAPEYKQNAWTDDYERAYAEFLADPVGFWERQAYHLEWIRPWDRVLEWDHPNARWFVGARRTSRTTAWTGTLQGGRRNKVALIWEGRGRGERARLHVLPARQRGLPVRERAQVPRRAEGRPGLHLHADGPRAGDRDARRAPGSAPSTRSSSAGSGRRRSTPGSSGRVQRSWSRPTSVPARERRSRSSTWSRRRSSTPPRSSTWSCSAAATEQPIEIHREMEVDFEEMMQAADRRCPCEEMDAEDPLFILYTSGSTGRRRGSSIPAAGTWSGPTTRQATSSTSTTTTSSGARPTRAGSRATPTSSTARSCSAAPSLVSERTPDYPDPGNYWEMIEEYGVNDLLHGPDRDPDVHEDGRAVARAGTTSRRSACSARWASRSTPRRWSGSTA